MTAACQEGVIVRGLGGLYYARDARGEVWVLRAKGADCVAAAHAYAAEPQLFDGLELVDPPPSWTQMAMRLKLGHLGCCWPSTAPCLSWRCWSDGSLSRQA